MQADQQIALEPFSCVAPQQWRVQRGYLGVERQPVLVIDNFSAEPDAWRKFATTLPFQALAPYYPGVRSPLSPDYLHLHLTPLIPLLEEMFDYRGKVSVQECFYSIVTRRGQDLSAMQSLPHVDGGGDRKLALLHYLCPESHGGTAFYRHRSTGFETVEQARFAHYKATLENEVGDDRSVQPGYIRDSNAWFERIGGCAAKYNRAIVYRGVNLHAIDIPEDFAFDPSPDGGRLTINTFIAPN